MAKNLNRTKRLYIRGRRYNWDFGHEGLYEILDDKDCDKGTALMLYWFSDPEWYTQYQDENEIPDYEKDNYNLIKYIEQKYEHITKEIIIYVPKEDEQVSSHPSIQVKKTLPPVMYQETKGTLHFKDIKTDYSSFEKLLGYFNEDLLGLFDEAKVNNELDEWIFFLKNGTVQEDFTAAELPKAEVKSGKLRLSLEERKAYKEYIEKENED